MPREKNANAYGSAPRWLLTMGDMNNLLLCFFIALFSLLSWEKPQYREGEQDAPQGSPIESESINQAVQVLRQAVDDKTSFTSEMQIEGTNTTVTKMPDYMKLTIGHESDPFDEASYALKPSHYRVLDVIRLWMVEYKNTIEIRGYTGVNVEDSLVVELDNIRKWAPEDAARAEKGEIAPNHRLLGFFRAQEVARYLIKPVQDEKRIDPARLVVISEGMYGTRRAPPVMGRPGDKPKDPQDPKPGTLPEKWMQRFRENQRFDRRVEIFILTPRQ